jgi:hypothetical protein
MYLFYLLNIMFCLKITSAGEAHSRLNGIYGRTKQIIDINYISPLTKENEEKGCDFRFLNKKEPPSTDLFIENIYKQQKLVRLLKIQSAFNYNPYISPDNLEQFSKNIKFCQQPPPTIGAFFILNQKTPMPPCPRIDSSIYLTLKDLPIFDTFPSVKNIRNGGLFNDFMQDEISFITDLTK